MASPNRQGGCGGSGRRTSLSARPGRGGVGLFMLGCVADRVIPFCAWPVLVVGPRPRGGGAEILISISSSSHVGAVGSRRSRFHVAGLSAVTGRARGTTSSRRPLRVLGVH